ncbi:hypothetical protein Ciccas_005219 [Cichlidogyrus casuarinus]|uniref:Uncharacterized protein n=1 Tax=Cichlidogyrus casuarinus TaxID=1844966 RepID=A0ABD2QBK3_9PLAT
MRFNLNVPTQNHIVPADTSNGSKSNRSFESRDTLPHQQASTSEEINNNNVADSTVPFTTRIPVQTKISTLPRKSPPVENGGLPRTESIKKLKSPQGVVINPNVNSSALDAFDHDADKTKKCCVIL